MPLAHLHLPAHLSTSLATALADAVHDALVATCGVPPDDRFQLIHRLGPEAMILNPTFPHVERSAAACIVEINFLRGRSDAQKAALYRHVVDAATQAGWRGDDIMIALTENSTADWSLGRGEAFAAVCHGIA